MPPVPGLNVQLLSQFSQHKNYWLIRPGSTELLFNSGGKTHFRNISRNSAARAMCLLSWQSDLSLHSDSNSGATRERKMFSFHFCRPNKFFISHAQNFYERPSSGKTVEINLVKLALWWKHRVWRCNQTAVKSGVTQFNSLQRNGYGIISTLSTLISNAISV